MSVNTLSPSNDGAGLYTMTDVYHLLIIHLRFNRTIDFANKMSNTDMNSQKTSVYHMIHNQQIGFFPYNIE